MELNIDSFQDVLVAEEMPGVKEIDLLQLVLDWLECNPQSALKVMHCLAGSDLVWFRLKSCLNLVHLNLLYVHPSSTA